SCHYRIAETLLIGLGQSQIEGLQRIEREVREGRADERAGQRAEGESAAEKCRRRGVVVPDEDLRAEPQVVRTARDVQVINDLFAPQERVVRQEDVPIEKAEAVDVQFRPERVVRTRKRIVVVVLE